MNDPSKQMDAGAGELEARAAALNSTANSPARWLAIARYYRWNQLARRGWSRLKQRVSGGRPIRLEAPPANLKLAQPPVAAEIARAVLEDWRGPYFDRGDVEAGKLKLLNRSLETGMQPGRDVNLSAMPHLWRFHYHYHEFLLAHVARGGDAGESSRWQTAWNAVGEWTDRFAPQAVRSNDDSWHPYCISRRLPVWFWMLAINSPHDELMAGVQVSIWQQANWLARNMEYEVGGNHLLENVTALMLTACFLQCEQGKQWYDLAERILEQQISRQILDHGEHFERAPMYHCQVLGNLLVVLLVARDCNRLSAEKLGKWKRTARAMWTYLEGILPPDDAIPLLGDSVFGEAPTVARLRQLASLAELEPPTPREVVQSPGDCWIFRQPASGKQQYLLFDRGAAAADELPAHGHCDLLNVIGCVEGRNWLIDSGNFDYEDGSMRQYCRSSMAHNVATIDGLNHCDIWSRFRMGHRGRVHDVNHGRQGELVWSTASHDAYRRMGIARLHRLVVAFGRRLCWCCVDWASGTANTRRRLTCFLHLAPEIQLTDGTTDEDGASFDLSDGQSAARLCFIGVASVIRRSGWHCPAFGVRHRTTVLEYTAASVDRATGWILVDAAIAGEIAESVGQVRELLPVHCRSGFQLADLTERN